MALTILSAKVELTFSVNISVYSLIISLLTQRMYLPLRKASHVGRYWLWNHPQEAISVENYVPHVQWVL